MHEQKTKTPSRLATASRFVAALATLAEAIAQLIKAVGGL
jgi:hypothetical protein